MKKQPILFTFLMLFFVFTACKKSLKHDVEATTLSENKQGTFGIVLHGGAGTILKENMSDSLEKAYRDVLKQAITIGHTVLKNGGSSVDAVTKTIMILENSPLFNAGKGAVFTHHETNELDASIMDGATLNAGAVAGVTRVKNPITLAVAVMNQSDHVMLSGRGAETFAEEKGIELVDSTYFFTQKRFESLQKVKQKEQDKDFQKTAFHDPYSKDTKFGTVGCVALDTYGNLAAGTSTGGMTNKRWNRIGDSPIIGAGTYANNATCAVSATGWGEFFIRGTVAHDISAMMEYKGSTLQEAAQIVIQQKLPALGGDGGIVAVDKDGTIAMEFNTAGMYRAHMNAKGETEIAIYQKE